MRLIEISAVAVATLMLLSPQSSLAAPPAGPEQPAAAAAAIAPATVINTPVAASATAEAPVAPSASAAATVKPAEKPKPVGPSLIAKVNLSTQVMTVQAGGKTMYTWKVSSGALGYSTPVGNFKPDWMSKMWYSKQYDDAPMPHSVFFKDGAAVHGTTSTGRLGTAASHGCVRLSLGNAETFYKLVQRHGLAQTRIIVSGHAPVSEDRIAKRDPHRNTGRAETVKWQPAASVPQMRVASRSMTYPGDRSYAYPAGSMQVNRAPYWAR